MELIEEFEKKFNVKKNSSSPCIQRPCGEKENAGGRIARRVHPLYSTLSIKPKLALPELTRFFFSW